MRYFVFMCCSLLQLFPEEGLPKPLSEVDNHGDEDGGGPKNERVRRSVPKLEAVNPMYTDYESLPNQEGPADPQSAGFALTDHLSNIFRSHKSSKHNAKQLPKHSSAEHAAVSLAKDTDSIEGEYLRSDEQEECYKQQNIAAPAPAVMEPPRGTGCPSIGVKNLARIADKERAAYIRGNLLKERSGKHYEEKEGEKSEITSLYSHPEKAFKPRKVKHYPQPKTPDLFNTDGRVYKPEDIDAQFPVYDGDLDFNPDPLQGILDDKYWLDPQEQEAVIRKYMDLAANVVPSELEIHKRSEPNAQPGGKSVESKTGYRQSAALDERCPCKQVVACGECSKGKLGKKTNITGSYEGETSNGRKLLSVDYEHDIEESRNDNEGDLSSLEYKDVEIPNNERNNEETQIDEHIPSVTMDNNENEVAQYSDNEMGAMILRDIEEDSNLINDNSIYLGRKLLWINEFDDSYDVDEENEEYEDRGNSELFKEVGYSDSKRSIPQYEDTYSADSAYEPNDESPRLEEHSNPRNFDSTNVYPTQELSNFYKPNKLANVFQKPLQKKLKGSQQKQHVNTTIEFDTLEHETWKNISGNVNGTPEQNASFEKMLLPPDQTDFTGLLLTPDNITSSVQNKVFKKRWDENPKHVYKGRRRYAEHESNKHRVVALAQSVDEAGGAGTKNTMKTSDSTVTTSSTSSSTEKTTSTVTSTSNSTIKRIEQTPSNNSKSVEEGVEDAQVADNIVKSVLKESQKSSVLGHNLGLCRRNESLVKVNYGRVIPETEKVIKTVTNCILERLKNHLAKQSCIILDPELLEFLKWLVITGESYREYKQRLPRIFDFVPQSFNHFQTGNATTAAATLPPCDPGKPWTGQGQQTGRAAISNIALDAPGLRGI